MEEVNFLIGALGCGIFVLCLMAGLGLCFYIMDNGLNFKKKEKK